MQWVYPHWAWLLVPGLLLLALYHYRTLSDFAKIQRNLSLLLRIVVVGLLVAAICGPVILEPTKTQMIIFAVDQSESIDDEAQQKANQFLAEATEAAKKQGAEVRFLPFATEPKALLAEWKPKEATADTVSGGAEDVGAAPPATNASASGDDDTTANDDLDIDVDEQPWSSASQQAENDVEQIYRRGTNLDAALNAAIAALPPSRVPRIVLLSDGNATSGGSSLATLSESNCPVDTVLLPVRSDPEVQLSGVQAPTQVRQGQPFYVEVVISSNQEAEGYVDLYRGDIQVGADNASKVKLKPGENRFRFRQSIEGKKQETFAARLRGFNDTLLDNNESSAIVYAVGRPRVLFIDRDVDQTDSLRWALDEQSIDLEVRPPEGIPNTLSELQAYECLVLSNVPATLMSMRQMDLIRMYVQDLGGGFIMLGGDESFGLGGYYRTQVEEILPVRSNFEKEKEKPSLAMLLVIDKSGSMGGQPIELAKDAAKAAVELLGPKDSIGVIAFDGSPTMVAEIRSTDNKGQIVDQISSIEASGGTAIYPALVEAYNALLPVSARLKHIILLTDGHSSDGDFQGLAGDISASRMTLSTVALGQGSSQQLLEELADIGGGRFYFCDDPQTVPQVFAKETMEASKSAINELPFAPQLVRPTPVLEGIEMDLAPLLLGYVVTRPKPTAEFILASEAGDPLLVWWRYGLGMSVAFTSDAKARWAAEWLSWPDFGPFWAQVIRHAMRKDDSKGVYVDIQRQGEQAVISMDAVDQNGQFVDQAETKLTVIDPKLGKQSIALKQTAPGHYEANLQTPEKGAYHLDLAQSQSNGEAQRISRGLTVGYSDELKLLPPGEAALQQISRASGGRYGISSSMVGEPDDRTAREPVPLWPWLLMAALVVFIADVAFRRIEIWQAPA
ncbi:MAG: VWA domain-containing protein [Fuerstiella sp.]